MLAPSVVAAVIGHGVRVSPTRSTPNAMMLPVPAAATWLILVFVMNRIFMPIVALITVTIIRGKLIQFYANVMTIEPNLVKYGTLHLKFNRNKTQ